MIVIVNNGICNSSSTLLCDIIIGDFYIKDKKKYLYRIFFSIMLIITFTFFLTWKIKQNKMFLSGPLGHGLRTIIF